MPKKQEFFDATIDEPQTKRDYNAEICEARAKAESQARVNASLTDSELKRQKKRNFIILCITSITSVAIFLILAIVFFMYLKIYSAGIGFAIIAVIISQIWIHFFKKLNKNAPNNFEEEDFDLLLTPKSTTEQQQEQTESTSKTDTEQQQEQTDNTSKTDKKQ